MPPANSVPIVAFAGLASQRDAYHRNLTDAATAADVEIALHMDPEGIDPATVDYLVFAANGPVQDFSPFTGLTAILNLWAGIEAVLELNPPSHVPLVRMARRCWSCSSPSV